MNHKTALVRIAFLLLALFMACVFLMLIAYKADAQIEAEDVGVLSGRYEVIWRNGAETDFELMYINEDGNRWYCRTEYMTHCVESTKPAPKVGAIYEKIGNQKFAPVSGDTQELRWDTTIYQKCELYIPEIEKEENKCTCDGYRNTVNKNNNFLFNLDLLPNGNVKDGVVNLTIGDSVSVLHTWNGGDPKNDPCFDRVEVKIKIEGNPEPKYASCNDSFTCVYSASMIGSDKYATVTDKVYFKNGSSCYGSWENFDPDSNGDPIVPGE